MEHLHCCGLVTLAVRQERLEWFPALVLSGRSLSRLQALGTPLSGDCCREIGKLLCLKREKLITGLARLQRPRSALARINKRRHLGAIAVEVPYNGGLHPHGILEAGN